MNEIEILLMVLCLELTLTGKVTDKADGFRHEIIRIVKQLQSENSTLKRELKTMKRGIQHCRDGRMTVEELLECYPEEK